MLMYSVKHRGSGFGSDPGSTCRHVFLDPVQEVADFDVDSIHVLIGTAFSPAHHTCQEPCLPVVGHQGPPAVPRTGVLPLHPVPSTQHVLGDVEFCVEPTLLEGDPW